MIAKLLKGTTVEWKPLREVTVYEQPTKYIVKSTDYKDSFKTPVLTAGKNFILGFTKETNNIYKAASKPVVIFDDFTTANKWVDFDFKIKSSAIKLISSINEEKLLLKYMYYWLNTLQTDFNQNDHKRQWIGNYGLKLIPIPPLSVQAEIVRILDAFTALTAELTAELKARKEQYNYYRDQLLTFKEGEVEWKTLGELLIRTKGTKITASQMKEIHKDNAPLKIFAGGKTFAYVNFNDIPAKDINNNPSIIVKSRGIIEFEYYDQPFSHKNEMWSYHSKNDDIITKYVYYYLKLHEPYFQNLGSRMQMPQIATPDTDNFQIPIPPLTEQERIVSILDKFDTLTTFITEGLPKEIALRQQQYEYYRNQLLNFPKA